MYNDWFMILTAFFVKIIDYVVKCVEQQHDTCFANRNCMLNVTAESCSLLVVVCGMIDILCNDSVMA